MPDYTIIEHYVDKAIALARKHHEYLMYIDRYYIQMYGDEVQPEMYIGSNPEEYQLKPKLMKLVQPDTSGLIVTKITDEYKEWKPVPANVVQKDIKELESYYSIKLPDSYKWYLGYMHFYQIFWNIDIKLYPSPINVWQSVLKKKNDEKRQFILDKGLFSIGEYSDHADICFDLLDEDCENGDYRIVYVDHESADEPELLASNFQSLLADILTKPEPELKELNASEQRLFGDILKV